MFSRTNMRFLNLFLCDIIAPWSSQAILFTFLFHEGDLKSSAGRVWVTRPALFVFTCLPVRPASRRRSVPVSHPYRRRCARPSRYAHRRSDRARTAARRRPALRRKIAAQKNKRHTSATPDRGTLKRVLGLGRQCNCTVCLFCCLSA